MAMFNPKTEYDVGFDTIQIQDFSAYKEEYVVRPPYQRKSVWSLKKKQALLDSLFRRYYVPRIVLRMVRLSAERTVKEVIDGQQRIVTAQEFFEGKIELPDSMANLYPDLAGKKYAELPADVRKFVDKELKYNADLIKGIEDPKNVEHQRIASEIFWRLQQGETLTYMEVAHARLSSLSRNFVVKYADDIMFDYEKYAPVDNNPNKHKFFTVIDRGNDRMQHLAIMTRFLILEEAGGPTAIQDKDVMECIEKYQVPDGIGNSSLEDRPPAKAVLKHLGLLFDVFKDDPMRGDGEDAVKELKIEYFIVSVYLLLRHLSSTYVWGESERELFRQFVVLFHQRWKRKAEEDRDIVAFSDSRQQTGAEVEARHRMMRQFFFAFAKENGRTLLTKDARREFSELDRIVIYRKNGGLCQECLREGKPEPECTVSWREYDADHVVPHSMGGQTTLDNGQLLCRHHNRALGARK